MCGLTVDCNGLLTGNDEHFVLLVLVRDMVKTHLLLSYCLFYLKFWLPHTSRLLC